MGSLRNLHDYDAMLQLKATSQICVNNLTDFFWGEDQDEAIAKNKDRMSFAQTLSQL